jgi:HlyD family secretion protein
VFAALGAVITSALLASGCFGGSVQGVQVVEVTRGDLIKSISATGVMQAAQPVDVVPQASATIVGLPVKDGDYVSAGDTLAVLDAQELAAQEAQARANYYTSQSIGDILQGSYANVQNLYGSLQYTSQVFGQMQGQIDSMVLNFYDLVPGLLSFLPVDQQEYLKALLAEQRASYLQSMNSRVQPPSLSSPGYPASAQEADAARTEAAAYNYEKTSQGTKSPNITAPVSGYVVFVTQQATVPTDVLSQLLGGLGSLTSSASSLTSLLGMSGAIGTGQTSEIKVGSQVTAGQATFQIVDLQSMSVKAQVDETDIPTVSKGQKVEISLDAYPSITFTGTVSQVAVKSESGSGGTTVFPVTINLDRTDIPLRLGYNATADIQVLDDQDVITVPVTALMEENGNDYIYVVEGGRAQRRQISTGPRSQNSVEVSSGLDVGERIVADGVSKVKEGQKVE